jgi:hypothetical protein
VIFNLVQRVVEDVQTPHLQRGQLRVDIQHVLCFRYTRGGNQIEGKGGVLGMGKVPHRPAPHIEFEINEFWKEAVIEDRDLKGCVVDLDIRNLPQSLQRGKDTVEIIFVVFDRAIKGVEAEHDGWRTFKDELIQGDLVVLGQNDHFVGGEGGVTSGSPIRGVGTTGEQLSNGFYEFAFVGMPRFYLIKKTYLNTLLSHDISFMDTAMNPRNKPNSKRT